MNLRDLLSDADESGDVAGAFRVFLATRTPDGKEMPPGQVHVMNIGMLRVDSNLREIGLIPADVVGEDEDTFTIAAARDMIDQRPEIGEFELVSLMEHQQFEDGSDAEAVCQIVATLTKHDQIWLLLYPPSQWQSLGLNS